MSRREERLKFARKRGHMQVDYPRTLGFDPVITPDVIVLGDNVEIASGAVIGEAGFGYARDEQNNPIHIAHTGRVIIFNHVWIGNHTVIHRGTVGDTILEEYVQLDAMVFVAHNVHIGARTLIAAGTVLGGSSVIGHDCFLATNVTVRNHVKIAPFSFIGSGAVVVKDIEEPNGVWVGNPARWLRERTEEDD